ncbi:MAG TPA: hypothetical protein VGD71_19120 [Kribbella sp.]
MKSTDLDLLRQADPAAAIPDRPLNDAELAALNRVSTRIAAEESVAGRTPAPSVRHGRSVVRRRTVLIGAAATLVAAVGLVAVDPFGSTGVAVAATPALLNGELQAGTPAKAHLLALAAAAARDASLLGDAGSTHSVHTSTWDLTTRVDGDIVGRPWCPRKPTCSGPVTSQDASWSGPARPISRPRATARRGSTPGSPASRDR